MEKNNILKKQGNLSKRFCFLIKIEVIEVIDWISNFIFRPTNKAAVQKSNGKGMEVGIADDQAKDFDFEKTEMKYDSTGMFHWTPAR